MDNTNGFRIPSNMSRQKTNGSGKPPGPAPDACPTTDRPPQNTRGPSARPSAPNPASDDLTPIAGVQPDATLTTPALARKRALEMLCPQVPVITDGLIESAKGNYLAAKFLFEFMGIFPPPPEADPKEKREESLTEVLLKRLDLWKDGDKEDDQRNSTDNPEQTRIP